MHRCFVFLCWVGLFPACTPSTPTKPVDPLVAELSPEVSRLRSLPFHRVVSTGRKSKAEIQEYIERRIAEEYSVGELALEREALTLLGVLPPDYPYEQVVIRVLREQIAGYYDPTASALFLADWMQEAEQSSVVVHELTHALQDQHFQLKRLMKRHPGNDDRTNAVNGLLEGDALTVMIDFGLRERNVTTVNIPDMSQALAAQMSAERSGQAGLKDLPPFFVESMIFPYVEGIRFVRHLRIHGGWKSVDGAYRTLPSASEQILHPEKYLNANDPPQEIAGTKIEAWLPPGVHVKMTNVLGEFGWRQVLDAGPSKEEAIQSAAGWGGDRYWLVADAARHFKGLVSLSSWDTELDAIEFEQTLKSIKFRDVLGFRRNQEFLLLIGMPKIVRQHIFSRWQSKS